MGLVIGRKMFLGINQKTQIRFPEISDIQLSAESSSEIGFSAKIKPKGNNVTVTVLYGLNLVETSIEENVINSPVSPSESEVTISGTLTNLQSYSNYFIRIIATISAGSTFSSWYEMKTQSLIAEKTVIAAYGFRKINPDYTGYCMTIFRADAQSLNVGFTSDGEIDVDAINAFHNNTNCFLGTLYSQFGSGRNLTITAANRPIIVESGVLVLNATGTRAAFRINTLYQALQTAVFTSVPQPYTKVVVADFGPTIEALEYLTDGSATNRSVLGTKDGLPNWRMGAGTNIDAATGPAINTQYIITAVYNGASSLMRVNKSQVSSGNAGTAPVDRITVGQHPNLNVSYIQFYGRITEIVYLSGVLSDIADIETEIENWLAGDLIGPLATGRFNDEARWNDFERPITI